MNEFAENNAGGQEPEPHPVVHDPLTRFVRAIVREEGDARSSILIADGVLELCQHRPARGRIPHAEAGPAPRRHGAAAIWIVVSAALKNNWHVVNATPAERELLAAHGFASGRVQ